MENKQACIQSYQWLNWVLPFVTTFLGAWLAFHWQNRHDVEKQEQDNYDALLKVQALFIEYFEVIYLINKDFLSVYKTDGEKEKKIKHISFCRKFSEFSYGSLAFILKTKIPDLYLDIVHTYRKCISAIESIDERNIQYKKMVDSEVKSTNQKNGEIVFAVHPCDYIFLKDFTNIMYREIDQAITATQAIDEKLFKFIKMYYNNKKKGLKVNLIMDK